MFYVCREVAESGFFVVSAQIRPTFAQRRGFFFLSKMKNKAEIRVSPTLCIKAALEAHSCNFLTFDIVRNDAITKTSESNSNALDVLMKMQDHKLKHHAFIH